MPFISIAVDPVTEKVILTGFGETLEECGEHATRVDSPYCRTFDLLEEDLPTKLHEWLAACGLSKADRTNVMRGVGRELQSIIDG